MLKAVAVWFVFMVFAILNGMLRVKLLTPQMGPKIALVLSGFLLAVVIFLVTFASLPVFKISQKKQYWMIAGLWALLTLAFEFLFGHYVIGESWRSLLNAYNVMSGNLWLLAMLSIIFSPYLAARLRKRY